MKKRVLREISAALTLCMVIVHICACNAAPNDAEDSSIESGSILSASYDSETAESDLTSSLVSETNSVDTGTDKDKKSSVHISSQKTDTSKQSAVNMGKLGSFLRLAPIHNSMTKNLRPVFKWSTSTNADSYTFVLEAYKDSLGKYVEVLKKTGIRGDTYSLTQDLTQSTIYRWNVIAVNGSGNRVSQGFNDDEGNIFMSFVEVSKHPANVGLNFNFKNTVSEQVLRNYLSRSMIVSGVTGEADKRDDILRMIYYTGAKYIGRAGGTWVPAKSYIDTFDIQLQTMKQAHAIDNDIVFEACIFENISRDVNKIEIPSNVLKAFGQKVEKRYFSYDNMIFLDGTFIDRFGSGRSVPDMTRIESQMLFYYLACSYIDLGYEGLHMGQIHLMGAHDSGWKSWTKLLKMVRAYARENARRGFVFINAHTHGIVGSDGVLLFDFHCYPMRGRALEGEVPHAPTEDNPQQIFLKVGYQDSIYLKSLGGKTYSGWSCDSLPYFVELDNWNGYSAEWLDYPVNGENITWWGFDEISWFANQPASYRAKWLEYAHNWIRTTDSAGYFEMPGIRTAAIRKGSIINQLTYYANSSVMTDYGFGDEDAIRQIWVNDRKKR